MKPGLEWNHPKPRIWTPREIEIFASHADEMGRWSVGTAVILNEWIGQREGDVLGMLRSAYQDGALRFEQSKTKVDIDLPRSEVRRGGKECVSTCRSRWGLDTKKKKRTQNQTTT